MSYNSIPKAIIDANVLYPASTRDFLLNIAALNIYLPFWTNQIHEEWIRNLLKHRKDLKRVSLNRTVKLMNSAFPHANVMNYSKKTLNLPDPNDEHVLAAAIKAKCKFIVTENTKDFPPNILDRYGIKTKTADQFISFLSSTNKEEILIAFENMLANLKNPPISRTKMIEILKNQKMSLTVKLLIQ